MGWVDRALDLAGQLRELGEASVHCCDVQDFEVVEYLDVRKDLEL